MAGTMETFLASLPSFKRKAARMRRNRLTRTSVLEHCGFANGTQQHVSMCQQDAAQERRLEMIQRKLEQLSLVDKGTADESDVTGKTPAPEPTETTKLIQKETMETV